LRAEQFERPHLLALGLDLLGLVTSELTTRPADRAPVPCTHCFPDFPVTPGAGVVAPDWARAKRSAGPSECWAQIAVMRSSRS